MRKRTTPTAHPTNISSRDISPLPWSYFVVIALCGCVLAAGFFLAARQHFTSMEFGMKNSQLRKQLEDLESEKRRLLLAREISLSPAEITRTARSLGFYDVGGGTSSFAVSASDKTVKPLFLKASVDRLPAIEAIPASITMTAYQRPVKAVQSEKTVKPVAPEKLVVKKLEAAKQKTIKTELAVIAKR